MKWVASNTIQVTKGPRFLVNWLWSSTVERVKTELIMLHSVFIHLDIPGPGGHCCHSNSWCTQLENQIIATGSISINIHWKIIVHYHILWPVMSVITDHAARYLFHRWLEGSCQLDWIWWRYQSDILLYLWPLFQLVPAENQNGASNSKRSKIMQRIVLHCH